MRIIKRTSRFKKDYKKDYKKASKNQHSKDLDIELHAIVNLLIGDAHLPEKYRDHPLLGDWKDHRDCHIRPDLVLIYRKPDDTTLELTRLGTHSDGSSFE